MNEYEKEQRAIKYIQSMAHDPKFYIPKLLKIRTKSGEIVNLEPNTPQKRLRDTLERLRKEGKPVRIIILKARQMGFSTYTEADCFHQTVTHENFNSFIITHEDKATSNLYDMYRRFYDKLPPFMKPMRKRNNDKGLLFENPTNDEMEKLNNPGLSSSVKLATAKNTDTGRSLTLNYVHSSEVAFWDNPKETMKSILQAVPRVANTTVIIESTANGVGDWFYDTWHRAVTNAKGNDFVPLFFAWWEMEEYQIPFEDEDEREDFIREVNYTYKDINGKTVHTEEWHLMKDYPDITYEKLKWRRWCISNNCSDDVKVFYQEYPSCPEEAFQSSGKPVFNTQALKEYLTNTEEGKRYEFEGDTLVEARQGSYTVYKHPEQGVNYSIGSDVAEGLENGDYSTAIVIDDDLDVVCKLHYHIDPDLHGKELVKLAKYYNNATIGVENNNHGLTTLKQITNIEDYWNLYYSKIVDKANDRVTDKLGWSTNAKTKPLMIDELATHIREKFLGIKDRGIIMELLSYVKDEKGKTNAQEGSHDDLVMALAIALQVHKEYFGVEYDSYNTESDDIYKVNSRDKFIDQQGSTEDYDNNGGEYSY